MSSDEKCVATELFAGKKFWLSMCLFDNLFVGFYVSHPNCTMAP